MVTSSCFFPGYSERTIARRTLEGISLLIVPVDYSNSMGFRARVRAFLRFAMKATWIACRERADVVLATSTPLTVAIPAIAARLLRGTPVVFEVRDLWPDLPIAMGVLRNPIWRAGARVLERMAYLTASHVVALSPGMADEIRKRGVPRERLHVIPNSCDLELFDVPAEHGQEIRTRLGLRDGQPLLTYAGTFGRINGVTYLVELAAALRRLQSDVHVLLVGNGAERVRVRQRAMELGVLGDNLTMWEPVEKQEMPRVLAASTLCASVFLPIPAMENNSANKFFDALAAGRPIAINYGGWQAELVNRNGIGVVLPPDDVEDAAKRIIRFLADPANVSSAGRAARELARSRFDRAMLSRQLESVLVAAASSRGSSEDGRSGPRR